MDRKRGAAAYAAGVVMVCGAWIVAPLEPAMAQGADNPASTINGTVPTVEGNIWGGLDHQPTQAEVPPSGDAKQQAKVNRKLNKLDQQLLNYPLPKVPSDAPPVSGN